MCFVCLRVPTVPVKNLNGSSPVHPALAGKHRNNHHYLLISSLFIIIHSLLLIQIL